MIPGKAVLVTVLFVATALFLAGCTNGSNNQIESLKISGSTTLLPVVEKAASEYMLENKSVDIVLSGGGSSVGVKATGEGTADIGMSSREVKSSELAQYPNLNVIPVAKDGITIIVNPSNSAAQLSLGQLRGIYNGTYTDWNQVGGSGGTIVVIGRDSTSGTREFFTSAVMKGGNSTPGMLEKNSNGGVKQTVSQTPGAIGYVGMGFADSAVKAVKLDVNGTLYEATEQNVLSGAYPLSRYLYVMTNGNATPAEQAFIVYLLGPVGKRIDREEGFVPLP